MVEPSPGSTVRRIATISADASDTDLESVTFLADGLRLSEDEVAPFHQAWDTTNWPDGSVALAVRARDEMGNVTTSSSRTVTIDNTSPETSIESGPGSSGTSAQFVLESNDP